MIYFSTLNCEELKNQWNERNDHGMKESKQLSDLKIV